MMIPFLRAQLKVAGDIIAKDGIGALYKGLSAGLLRQATYTTARMGIFNVISEQLTAANSGKVSRQAGTVVIGACEPSCSLHYTLRTCAVACMPHGSADTSMDSLVSPGREVAAAPAGCHPTHPLQSVASMSHGRQRAAASLAPLQACTT